MKQTNLLVLVLGLLIYLPAYSQWAGPKPIQIVGGVCKRNHGFHDEAKSTQSIVYPAGYYNYYVHHYTLRLKPNFTTQSIQGQTSFHFRPTGRLDTLVFDLSSQLAVDSIKFHGATITTVRLPNELVGAILPVTPSAMDTLEVWYSGTPSSSGFGSISFDNHSSGQVMATLSEPYGARDWWATRQDYFQKIDSVDVLITTDGTKIGISNGTCVDTSTNAGLTTYHWKQKYPIVNYLVATAVSNYACIYDTVRLTNGVMPLRHCFFPQNRNTWIRDAPMIKAMLRNFEKKYSPYPFFNHGYSHTQFTFGGGQEHQSNSFMANLDYYLQNHELGHQWFGDYITCKGMRDIWLNEGFATYSEYLTDEAMRPNNRINWLRNANSGATGSLTGSVYKYDTTNVGNIFDYGTTYLKGGLVLHQLRRTVGDSLFFASVKNYLNDPIVANNFARTGDLARVFTATCGRNMQPFFDAFIMGRGFPLYSVTNAQLQNDTLSFVLNQSPSAPNGPFFPAAIPVTFGNGTNSDTTAYINHQVQGQVVKIKTRYVPTNFRINTTNEAVTRLVTVPVTLVTSIQEKVATNSLMVWPNPASDNLQFAIRGTTQLQVRYQLQNQIGQTVQSGYHLTGTALPIETLPNGLYTLLVWDGQTQFKTSIAKQ